MSDSITIIGNLGGPPRQRTTSSGKLVTGFSVATTERRRDPQSGKWEDTHTNWYEVSAWDSLGEHAFASLQQGQRVIVTGRLRLNAWENGEKSGKSFEVNADAIGHDLKWGTSNFQRDERGDTERPQPAGSENQAANGWATPGADAEPPLRDHEADRELVSASAGSETPF